MNPVDLLINQVEAKETFDHILNWMCEISDGVRPLPTREEFDDMVQDGIRVHLSLSVLGRKLTCEEPTLT